MMILISIYFGFSAYVMYLYVRYHLDIHYIVLDSMEYPDRSWKNTVKSVIRGVRRG